MALGVISRMQCLPCDGKGEERWVMGEIDLNKFY